MIESLKSRSSVRIGDFSGRRDFVNGGLRYAVLRFDRCLRKMMFSRPDEAESQAFLTGYLIQLLESATVIRTLA